MRETGLTAATVSELVSQLATDGIVSDVGIAPSSGGKPPVLVDINADSRSIITIDLGGVRWEGSVRNLRHEIIHTIGVEQHDRRGDEAVEAVISLIRELMALSPSRVLGVGVGTPGVVTSDGLVVEASNLGWSNLPLGRILTEAIDAPIHVVNDARAAAIAEHLLGHHNTGNLIVVRLGRGVGSGIILNGNIHSGEASAAGEIGHIASIPRDTDLVTLESVASTPAIAQALADGLGRPVDDRPSKFIAAHVADDIELTAEIVRQIGYDMAAILASVVATLDVHKIILSGPIVVFGDDLLKAIQVGLSARILPSLAQLVSVTYGHVDETSAVESGAATYLMQQEIGVA